jgi:carnitine-CoA ligase
VTPILDPADPRVPVPDACVVANVLEERARSQPDEVLVELETGERWNHSRMLDAIHRTAAGLQELGVRRGDRVVSWLPNGIEGIRLILATSALGATFVGLNTAYRGAMLEHAIRLANAKVAVVHFSLTARLADINRGPIETIVEIGDRSGTETLGWETLDSDRAISDDGRTTEPWDPFAIVFTSGTTGPSKAVLSSYVHHYSFATAMQTGLNHPGDRVLYMSPLFHITGTAGLVGALLNGHTLVQSSGFDTHTFWSSIRERSIDSTFIFAPMMSFLLQAPPGPEDREHPLRSIVTSPLTSDALRFAERFGVELHTAYSMTEISTPIISPPNPTKVGSCGVLRPGVAAQLVDDHDCTVAVGKVGELVLRPDRPWSFSHGYDGDAAATARAWRNGWFHTGDAFRQDPDGTFFFVDRVKDAIRRRGENISSFELESAVLLHPTVVQAAAIAVRSELGEDEVLIAAVARKGSAIDPIELTEFLIPRLPYYMVPRYVRVLDHLPMTPSARVQKDLLRAEGLAPGTWDRETSGIRVRRERFD